MILKLRSVPANVYSSVSFNMEKKPLIRAGIYQHYKGNLYKVIGIARHSEKDELMVVYRAQTGDHDLWVRPYKMFIEHVQVGQSRVPRFKFLHP